MYAQIKKSIERIGRSEKNLIEIMFSMQRRCKHLNVHKNKHGTWRVCTDCMFAEEGGDGDTYHILKQVHDGAMPSEILFPTQFGFRYSRVKKNSNASFEVLFENERINQIALATAPVEEVRPKVKVERVNTKE